jgi:hypothetical protein
MWTESFETQLFFPPDHWIIVNKDALDATWYMCATDGYTGTHCATCDGDTLYAGLSLTNDDYLITPQVVPQNGDTVISFWYRIAPGIACSLDVMVSSLSPPAPEQFNILHTTVVNTSAWIQGSVSLASYSGVPVYCAFRLRQLEPGSQVFIDEVTLPDMSAQPYVCNGRLRTKGPPSQKYLQVWGSHYEMGYAHGYLLGEEAMANLIRFAVGSSSFHVVSPIEYEYGVLPYFRLRFSVPQKYQDEAQGAYDGLIAKGVDLVHPELGREITVEDILCLSAICDFNVFGCSSISGWGESTIDDDSLQGGLVLARDLDYRSGLYTSIGNTSIITACAPSATDEQAFVTVNISGLIGCLSGMNEHGVGLCCDYGYNQDTAYIPPNSLVPFSMSCRHALEAADPDGSGVDDIYDLTYVIHDSTSLTCWDVHLFSPFDAIHTVSAAILEMNNVADSLRLVSDNHLPPMINSEYNLCVTNHERVLYPPVYCDRYELMAESLNADFHLTTDRAVAIENAAAGWSYYAGTIQSTVFRPNVAVEHPSWPCIGVSYARRNHGAHTQPRIYYTWEELFAGVPGAEEHGSMQLENTVPCATIIHDPLQLPHGESYVVYDIAGRIVIAHTMKPGVYFLVAKGEAVKKIILIR